MIYAPNVFHSLLYTVAQYYFTQYVKWRYGSWISYVTLLLMASNSMMSVIMPWTFSNSIECSLLMIGVYIWDRIPAELSFKSQSKWFDFWVMAVTFLVTISFMIRTTSAVGWFPLIFHKAFVQKNFLKFAVAGMFIAAPLLGLMLLMDSWFYGWFTFTFFNFLQFNVLSGGSDVFGTEPGDFYLVSFLGEYTRSLFIPFYLGLMISLKDWIWKWEFPEASIVFLFYVAIFSNIPHKEARFMAPLAPFIMIHISLFL